MCLLINLNFDSSYKCKQIINNSKFYLNHPLNVIVLLLHPLRSNFTMQYLIMILRHDLWETLL